jgi:thiol-disulfide isomerase/thioredoxin
MNTFRNPLTLTLAIYLCLLQSGVVGQTAKTTSKTNGYELTFKITGLRDSLCYLANYYGEKQYIKDSAYASPAGQVVFKGAEKLDGGIYLFVFPNKTYFEVLIDQEQHFTLEAVKDNVIATMKTTHTNDNEEFYKYLRFIQEKSQMVEPYRNQRKQLVEAKQPTDSVDARIRRIDDEVKKYKADVIDKNGSSFLSTILNSSKEPEIPEIPTLANGQKDSTFAYRYYKAHYFDYLNLSDERILRSPIYHNKVSAYLKNMVLQIPDSLKKECDMLISKAKDNKETYKYMVWYTTNTYETSNIMGLDEVFVYLVKKYYTSKESAYWLDEATLYKIQDRARILEPILIGKKAKNLILTDSNNVARSMYDIQAKYTILVFWDPDCGHCKKSMPVVKATYDKYKSKGVQVYAVCTEVEMDKWRAFIRENKLEWINVANPELNNNFRQEFDILTTPQLFVLDKDKKIIAKKIDAETLEKILEREFEK